MVVSTGLAGTEHRLVVPNGNHLTITHNQVAIARVLRQLPLCSAEPQQQPLKVVTIELIHTGTSVPCVAAIANQSFDLLDADAALTATLHGVCGEFHHLAPAAAGCSRPA